MAFTNSVGSDLVITVDMVLAASKNTIPTYCPNQSEYMEFVSAITFDTVAFRFLRKSAWKLKDKVVLEIQPTNVRSG